MLEDGGESQAPSNGKPIIILAELQLCKQNSCFPVKSVLAPKSI